MQQFANGPPRIGLALGRIDRRHHGFGEFAEQLGRRLVERLRGVADVRVQARPGLGPIAGRGIPYLRIRGWQRLLHLQQERFDLWHSFNQVLEAPPPVGARRSVVTIHDLNFRYAGGLRRLLRGWFGIRRCLRTHGRFVTVSRFVLQDLLDGPLRVSAAAGRVVYNGVTPLTGMPAARPQGAPTGPFLMHLSRMTPLKNVEALLAVARAWPDMPWVLAGPDRADSRRIAREVAEQGLRHVTVLLNLSEAEKAWLYAHCAGFVFPSLAEGFGLPPLEAMQFGKPVFLSRLTSLPEIGGDAAFYFDTFEPSGMRATLEHGLERSRSPAVAARARDRAARFSWDLCADAYLRLYEELLDCRLR